jgi:DNA invertase Pin-like site-specific DNA recombinase
MDTETVRVGPYLRKSAKERRSKNGQRPEVSESVTEQDKYARADAERHTGWMIAEVYSDDGVSASKFTRKVRGDWQRLRGDVRARRLDLVWLWESDRGGREMEDWCGFLNDCERTGTLIYIHTHGEHIYDCRIPRDKKALQEDGVDAEYSSAKSALNIKRAMAEKAERGDPHGFVPYGWRREYFHGADGRIIGSRDVVVEDQADVIREGTRRVIGGESLRSVAADLNDRGIPSPRGKAWNSTTLRQVLKRERNVGLRGHNGERHEGTGWDPILVKKDRKGGLVADTDTFDLLEAILKQNSDDYAASGGSAVSKYLLAGIARCGACDSPVRALRQAKANVDCYTCPGCFKVRRKRADVDDLVTRLVVGRLAKRDAAKLLAGDDDATRDLVAKRDALRANLKNAESELNRALTRESNPAVVKALTRQLVQQTTMLTPQLDELDQKIKASRGSGSHNLTDLARPDIAEVWGDGVPLERKRAVIDALMTITILPVGSGTRWDPRSVKIEWNKRASRK